LKRMPLPTGVNWSLDGEYVLVVVFMSISWCVVWESMDTW
jgi:hypothetical protein